MQRAAQASFSRNRLLSIMNPEDFESLRPNLGRVSFNVRDVLEEPGQPVEHVYFPEPSVCSVVATTTLG